MFIPNNLTSKIELNTVLDEFRKYSVLSITADLFDKSIFDSEKQYELRSMEINRYLRTGTNIELRQFYLDNADTIFESIFKQSFILNIPHIKTIKGVFELMHVIINSDIEEFEEIFTSKIDKSDIELIYNKINAIADKDGKIKDNASKTLKEIRKKLRNLESRQDKVINESISKYSGILMSDRITLSEERIVLQVKASSQGEITGILHDYSDTHKTAFIEPDEFVKYNNELKETKLDEMKEVLRILAEIKTMLIQKESTVKESIEVIIKIDSYNVILRYIKKYQATYPIIKSGIRITNARNPVLLRTIGKETVPFDLELNKGKSLLITGPNMGGKTVILKTLGLFAMLMRKGLPITCNEGSQMPFFSNVFADIGDDQSMEKGVSTFASHIINYKEFTVKANRNALILLDEVGSGTSAKEGAAFASALLTYLIDKQSTVIFTSHLDALKEFSNRNENIEFASMMFDIENNKPLYRLNPGSMGNSGVINLIKRYSFPEVIIEASKKMLGNDYLDYTHLNTLYREKIAETDDLRNMLSHQRKVLSRLEELANSKEETLKSKLKNLKKEFQKQKNDELIKMRSEFEHIVKEIKEADASKASIKTAKEFVNKKLIDLDKKTEGNILHKVEIGQNVLIDDNVSGIVDSVDDNRVIVDINGVKVTTYIDKITQILDIKQSEISVTDDINVSDKLDLRGLYADEAILELDTFIDKAKTAGLKTLQIIHGHGTGVLKTGVREHLSMRKDIKSYQSGIDHHLNDGITIVNL